MPRVSAFYGIVIWMYHDEPHHLRRPHFHARYGDDEASIEIAEVTIIAGGLPRRALRLVVEWAREHEEELRGELGPRPSPRSAQANRSAQVEALRWVQCAAHPY